MEEAEASALHGDAQVYMWWLAWLDVATVTPQRLRRPRPTIFDVHGQQVANGGVTQEAGIVAVLAVLFVGYALIQRMM